MKKTLLSILLLLIASLSAKAYDFSAVCSTGQTLYYNINGTNVTVTPPENNSSSWSGYSEPTGNLIIPSSVTNNGTTYSVTSIGDYAFFFCSGLTSVSIPNSVTSIGGSAFSYCSGLTTVNFNATNCTTMGTSNDEVFYDCTSLTTLNIGNNVQRIPSYAFYGCSGLTSLTIPNSVTSIGDYAFYDCSGLTSLTIPNSVTSIGDGAFSGCSGLTGTLTIPNSVTSIGDGAFSGCSGLTGTLTIPNSVTSIGSGAFYVCTGLTSITIPNSVTRINSCTFLGCSGLTSITIPNSVTTIGDTCFGGCFGLTSLTVPNSVTTIGDDAFSYCSGLTSITIPNSVTTIGSRAFSGCTGLTTVNFNATNCTSARQAFRDCSSLSTLSIGNNVQRIPDEAFYGCGSLQGVLTIPNSVRTIGHGAFAGCTGLTDTLTIPDSVTFIGHSAFSGCIGLTAVNFNAFNCIMMEMPYNSYYSPGVFSIFNSLTTLKIGNNVQRIPDYAFYNCGSLQGVLTIPNSVRTIGNSAFYGCSSLTSVTIGNAIDTIYSGAFLNDTNLTAVYYTGDMAGWCDINFGNHTANPLFYAHNLYVNNNLVSNLIIPNGVTKIKDFTFARATCLTSVSIPNSVSSIGMYSFYECANISSVSIPSSVTLIGLHAFGNCSGLTSAYYTGDIAGWCGITFTSFASNPLRYAHNLYIDNSLVTNLVVPEGVAEIKKNAFFRAYCITSVSLPSTLTSIGDSVFFYDSTITELYTKNPVPPTAGNISFYKVPTTIPVYIPCGRTAYYTAANGWSNFSNFVEENPASFSAVSVDPTKGAVQILTMPTCTNPQAVVYASPNSGYQFDHWSNGSTANPLTLTVTEDMELIAYFSPVGSQPTTNYTITVVANDPTMGTVTGGGSYAVGSTATLTATANSGYHFVQWHDGNTQASRSITVTGDSTYTAYFAANAENEYTITVIPQNPAMGSTTGSGTFPYGTQTTITAEPNPGYLFVQWQDGNTQRIRTITVTGEATYTAYFDRNYGIDDIAADDIKVYVNGRNIVIEGSLDESVMVYDVMGRTIYHDVVRAPITAPVAGVYMVKIGNTKARKVVILR